ncbi:F11 receptor, tandem duplicate 1 [Anguilla rostrata]|uniref:Junctional adhesion molecule A n=1 Tax=Anguilla anguilla TaxID=7936 RepID=A0A9D3M8V3_ANGAN|nr:F11 receptor, tandem duplicate 1 [Anguilla anguilla]KAG5843999.1 hypothetical protein ANANG_G00156820 [Anguilla anguilla]
MFAFAFMLLFLQTTDTVAFDVTTSTPVVNVPENQGADLKCSYTADFGTPRLEWKFKNLKASQTLVIFNGAPTAGYTGRVELYTGGLRFNKVTRADNGEYTCEVSSSQGFGEAVVKLVVQVPPSKPLCRIPTSVTTGRQVTLSCFDKDGSPPCTYKWFKNNTPLPEDPSKFPAFKNSSFTIDSKSGDLVFPKISKLDSGSYFCTASNGAGAPQSCAAVQMAVQDLNTGGIAAGVIIALLALGLLAFGLWYAHRKGYLPKKSESKPRALYQPPSDYVDEEDGEFRQKSSFVV